MGPFNLGAFLILVLCSSSGGTLNLDFIITITVLAAEPPPARIWMYILALEVVRFFLVCFFLFICLFFSLTLIQQTRLLELPTNT